MVLPLMYCNSIIESSPVHGGFIVNDPELLCRLVVAEIVVLVLDGEGVAQHAVLMLFKVKEILNT